jgi:signal transduction histidine kinase/CheY-like chemotaxis protein
MNVSWIGEYAKGLRLANGGYGMILSQYLTIMFHPDESILGFQLQELSGDFVDIARRLRQGEEIPGERVNNRTGAQVIAFFRPIYNGWYLGLLTPVFSYYRDLYLAALILSAAGIVMALFLSYVLLRISAAKMRADEESRSKTTFLARMSHEIRTPMNAIIGMSELALRENLPAKAREYVGNVHRAGDNLLSIINDILDFSKIDSGKLEIINAEYQFASVINDAVSIISMRLGDKPLLFVTRIDSSLPKTLYGDEARLRQILLNLLSNAVKYTREGSVTLTVSGQPWAGGQPRAGGQPLNGGQEERIELLFEIADTGIGIRPEDMDKLFGEFQQFDSRHNRGIEGTGLGLAITRNLCRLMGGDVSVQSVYGQGSVFTAAVPQVIRNKAPFAQVEHPETKNVLVYENRPAYAESVVYTIGSLGAGCALARTHEDFVERLTGGEWQFVIAASALCEEVEAVLEERRIHVTLALLSAPGETPRPDKPSIVMPVLLWAVTDMLNGKTGGAGSTESKKPGLRFTAPDARILIVDDILTNIQVAEGLLAPYQMKIDYATGGVEAIQKARENRYDLILMDHMMPGMDGIEATARIREWETEQLKKASLNVTEGETRENQQVPIIALTANAISGMKEMFLENGFNDFISKPIDISRLDAKMGQWLPAHKKVKSGVQVQREAVTGDAGISIPGVDVKRGLAMTGGTEAGYRKVLSMFYKDAQSRLPILRSFFGTQSDFAEQNSAPDALPQFVTQVHALKSAAGSLGAAEISAEAARLEASGKAGDLAAVRQALPAFIERLAALVEGIGAALNISAEISPDGESSRDLSAVVNTLLSGLAAALEAQKAEDIDRVMEELSRQELDSETREIIDQISDDVLMAEYGKALETVKRLKETEDQ